MESKSVRSHGCFQARSRSNSSRLTDDLGDSHGRSGLLPARGSFRFVWLLCQRRWPRYRRPGTVRRGHRFAGMAGGHARRRSPRFATDALHPRRHSAVRDRACVPGRGASRRGWPTRRALACRCRRQAGPSNRVGRRNASVQLVGRGGSAARSDSGSACHSRRRLARLDSAGRDDLGIFSICHLVQSRAGLRILRALAVFPRGVAGAELSWRRCAGRGFCWLSALRDAGAYETRARHAGERSSVRSRQSEACSSSFSR